MPFHGIFFRSVLFFYNILILEQGVQSARGKMVHQKKSHYSKVFMDCRNVKFSLSLILGCLVVEMADQVVVMVVVVVVVVLFIVKTVRCSVFIFFTFIK